MASLCTGKVIRSYFFEGELPANGMVCPTNETLFPPTENTTNYMTWTNGDALDMEDERLLQNLKGLGEEMRPFLLRRGQW